MQASEGKEMVGQTRAVGMSRMLVMARAASFVPEFRRIFGISLNFFLENFLELPSLG